jgi:hypothetical protein
MKISNLETAMKLSKITGRPLEEFYEQPVQATEIPESQCSDEPEEDISEIEDLDEETIDINDDADNNRPINKEDDTRPREDDVYTVKYGGKYSENGVIIGHTKDMTNAEYKSLTKKMTQSELLKSPLLFVFFRAEEQNEGHFWHWLEKFPKE